MAVEAPQAETNSERLNFYLSPSLRTRLAAVALIRRTTEAPTVRWLLERALDQFEGLSREEREAL